MTTKVTRLEYSEDDAARQLGISVERLRTLVRRHLSDDQELPANSIYYASDLIALRIFARLEPANGESSIIHEQL